MISVINILIYKKFDFTPLQTYKIALKNKRIKL